MKGRDVDEWSFSCIYLFGQAFNVYLSITTCN